jgi:hypothetical protein
MTIATAAVASASPAFQVDCCVIGAGVIGKLKLYTQVYSSISIVSYITAGLVLVGLAFSTTTTTTTNGIQRFGCRPLVGENRKRSVACGSRIRHLQW